MKIVTLDQLPLQSVSHNPEIQKRVMLKAGDVAHLTNFSQATFAPGQVASAHAHRDMVEVFFVSAGSGQALVDGQTLPLQPGSCLTIYPHERHEIANTGDVPLVLTYFGIAVDDPSE
jgi:mannose-6-phosphate isomerase-like protein (cupin superfamily)